MSFDYDIIKRITHDFYPGVNDCFIYSSSHLDRKIAAFIRNIREQGIAEKYMIPSEESYQFTFDGAEKLADYIQNLDEDDEFYKSLNNSIAFSLRDSVKEIKTLEKIENCPVHIELYLFVY